MSNPVADYDAVADHIRRFEKLNDDHAPSQTTIDKYQDFLDTTSAPYHYESVLAYLYAGFYELQALIHLARGDSEQSRTFLVEASDILPADRAFVSTAARNWQQQYLAQATALSQQRYQQAVGRKRFSKRTRIIVWSVVGVCVIGAIVSGPISDYFTLKNADPTMVKLADDAGMTRRAKLIFFRTKPQLVDDATLGSACPNAQTNSDGFIEQGCFVPDSSDPTTGRIYIRKMPDNLYNLEVTTAAYEMLHPAYLGIDGNADTNSALNQAIEANLNALSNGGDDLSDQVANFAKTEPGARDLELFSILGTEYDGLSQTLLNYYTPYLSDPSKVVSLNDQVNQLFKTDENQLADLKQKIQNAHNLAQTAYANSVSWAEAGNQYEDDYNYNIYKQDLDLENSYVDQYNALLDQYNVLVDEYNGQQFTPESQAQTN